MVSGQPVVDIRRDHRGSTHIYVVPLNGGPMKRLLDGKATEIDPEWSRDGRSIYYSSNESGGWAIWRMAADGNARVRLTSEAGFEARQSPDERSIYFIDRQRMVYGLGPVATLKRVSIEGGTAEVVDARVMPGAWEMTAVGIVFVAARAGANGHLQLAECVGDVRLRGTPRAHARRARISHRSLWRQPLPHRVARRSMGAGQPR
jgi:dipeptidyl aminopeptidase/acylaminoacyl peptidase